MSDLSKWLRSDRDWPEGTKAGMLAAADELDGLRAEVERLQHLYKIGKDQCAMLYNEVERLKALSQNNAHSWDVIVRERDELHAKIERLRIECEDHKAARLAHEQTNAPLLAAHAEVARLTGLLNAKTTPGYELLAATIVAKDADIARLRAALSFYGDHASYGRGRIRFEGERPEVMKDNGKLARRTLEGK